MKRVYSLISDVMVFLGFFLICVAIANNTAGLASGAASFIAGAAAVASGLVIESCGQRGRRRR